MKILVIEDDAVIRESLCEMLGHWGYVPEAAADGKQGWELLQWETYDLVLLDLNLPHLDGMELCRQLPAAGTSPHPQGTSDPRGTAQGRWAGPLQGAADSGRLEWP